MLFHFSKSYLMFVFMRFFAKSQEIFGTDLADDFNIELSENGYKSVKLKCNANHMNVDIEMNKIFNGLIYTRGSFYDKKFPCFLDSINSENKTIFSLRFSLRECNTKKDKDKYLNTLVLQHDRELIMPGDAAFTLECDFRKFRETTDTLIIVEKYVTSSIGLTNADPAKELSDALPLIRSDSNTVYLTPDNYKKKKDEL
ncbi:hypothetical protein WA026_006665 [Henosepilachna vigintioctopunctata]|uniref:ZP domain-containing protein n=1 Tax=Henosepilachna vigintioctopunctata TaxID=420089 RepID=A0AAW1UJN6_9CUCU